MNQISIKVARPTHRKWKYGVKSRETEIKPAEKIVSISKFCAVTYLDFLQAGIIHDGTLNKKSFAEIYLVQFSVNYNMPFFDVS